MCLFLQVVRYLAAVCFQRIRFYIGHVHDIVCMKCLCIISFV